MQGDPNYVNGYNGFTAKRWCKKTDTLIIDKLWSIINENDNLSFDELYLKLKEYYKNKTEKSFAEIYLEKGFENIDRYIQITNKSIIFPNILIIKK